MLANSILELFVIIVINIIIVLSLLSFLFLLGIFVCCICFFIFFVPVWINKLKWYLVLKWQEIMLRRERERY